MRHDDPRIWADAEKGETPELVLAAIGMAAACLAGPVDPEDKSWKATVGFDDVRPYIDGDQGILMLTCLGRKTCLRVMRVPGGTSEYRLNSCYGDPRQLLNLAESLLELLVQVKNGSLRL